MTTSWTSTSWSPCSSVGLATTWLLAFDRLSPPARALLTLLSFYAPDAIPAHLLLAPPDPESMKLPEEIASHVRPALVDEVTRYTTLQELFAYSLVPPHRVKDAEHAPRLVQAVIWDQLTDIPSPIWASAAQTLLNAAWPELPATAATVARWHSLHTHVRTVISHLPPEHPDTLITRDNLARWTGHAGDATAAQDLYADLAPIRARVLGPEHPNTLTTRNNLAYWTKRAASPGGGGPGQASPEQPGTRP